MIENQPQKEKSGTLILEIRTPDATTIGMPNFATATYTLSLNQIMKQSIRQNEKRGEKDKREGKNDRFEQRWIGGSYMVIIHGPMKYQQPDYDYLKIKSNFESKQKEFLSGFIGNNLERLCRGATKKFKTYLNEHYSVDLIPDKEEA